MCCSEWVVAVRQRGQLKIDICKTMPADEIHILRLLLVKDYCPLHIHLS